MTPAKIQLAGVDRVVLIASGKGGVGKSTIATNLSVALAQGGLRVGLLDADFHGPSTPTMFGAHQRPSVLDGRIQPGKYFGVKLLSAGMLGDPDKAFVWRGPLLRGVMKQLLRDTDWAPLDILLIDLPPGTGEVQIAVLTMVDPLGAIVVTTPQEVARADVRRCLAMFRTLGIRCLAIVENMAQHACPHCGKITRVFPGNSGEELAEEFNVKNLVRLPLVYGIAESADEGVPALASGSADGEAIIAGFRELVQILGESA